MFYFPHGLNRRKVDEKKPVTEQKKLYISG